MARTRWLFLAGMMLALGGIAIADEKQVAPAGTWKLVFAGGQGQPSAYWLVKFESKDGQWNGAVLDSAQGLPPGGVVQNVSVDAERLRFTLKFQGQNFTFEGKVPGDKNGKILGSFQLGRQLVVAQLEPSTLKSLKNRYEVAKEDFARTEGGQAVFDLAMDLLRQAGAQKAKPEEVRSWADRAAKLAETYGPRWQSEIAIRITESLLAQEGFAPISLEYARRAERSLDSKDDNAVQVRVLEALSAALRKADKVDDAKEVDSRIGKLESAGDQEYLNRFPPLKGVPFKGRKGESTRAVLLELFTGVQCPPCVAADLAFDAVNRTYKPTEVVLLQYHLHVPGPDPLTNPDSVARSRYYDKEVEGTPATLFNGKPGAEGGGFLDDAQDKLNDYRKVIDPLLEEASPVKLKLNAGRNATKIFITAEASGIEKPGEDLRLRLALTEKEVRYAGPNQMRLHHHVVRAMPGGAEGLALTDKMAKQEVSVDLEKLRTDLAKYLDDFSKKSPFPNSRRPLDLRNLHVVAFVQNDKTKEVLNAVEVALPTEKD